MEKEKGERIHVCIVTEMARIKMMMMIHLKKFHFFYHEDGVISFDVKYCTVL
jgi:hypothetical protein